MFGGVVCEARVLADQELFRAVGRKLRRGGSRACAEHQDGEAAAHGGQSRPGEGDGGERCVLELALGRELGDDQCVRHVRVSPQITLETLRSLSTSSFTSFTLMPAERAAGRSKPT